MSKGRLEAFSDGVVAILITIMVLELKIPKQGDWRALQPLVPVFLAYGLSYVSLGIYWNNHHHMFHMVDRINGKILWANLHLLFWLSLVPFVTGWVGENPTAAVPTAVYGLVLVLSAVAYVVLQRTIVAHQGPSSKLAEAVGMDVKGQISLALYILALPLAFVRPQISDGIYVLVAAMWFIPDRRIEGRVNGR